MKKIVVEKNQLFECPICGFRWSDKSELYHDQKATNNYFCPACGEKIDDGGNEEESL